MTSHKQAWTKGPLSVEHEELCSRVYDGKQIIAVFHQSRRMGLTQEARQANAVLYTAAPEMYEALKAHDIYMSDQFVDGPDSRALHPDASANWKRVRAALTKAEGGKDV